MREALKLLLNEMEYVLRCIDEDIVPFDDDDFHEALRLGKEALAQPDYRSVKTYHEGKPVYVSQPEQEPYGYVWLDTANFRKKITPTGESEAWNAVYTTPPQRTWVGLTDVQKSLDNAPPHFDRSQASAWQDGVYWAEAKLKEKNT